MNGKLFGREPAAFISVVGAVLTVIAALNFDFLTAGMAAAITAVVAAGVMIWTTRPLAPSLITGAWTALVALFAEYGLELSDELVAAVSAGALALFAFIAREQLEPVDTRITRA